ncbi:unnamed protein product [Spirodela intermedia]|uniref:Cytokinin riboside 5'-monophosphate phosphoribohydrolase n=1 Tax=Spirodela intermedia TaxID=51605 RepID=A0A7I8IGU8_SPIIN|nr:unnamed protein product [Spirodela intermedia]CAA6656082.1 unnamed protein product [Spirodela intermedia]
MKRIKLIGQGHCAVGCRRKGAMEVDEGKSPFRSVCVFCGSSTGKKQSYQDAAVELGAELVARKVDLVYGGGSVGLMGLVSQAVHKGGGHVLGRCPSFPVGLCISLSLAHATSSFVFVLFPFSQVTGETVGEVKVVDGMHQRKAEMSRHSDAFIALPGGYGTLEELLEVISWAQLGIHRKPVGLMNVDGYYDALLALIDSAVGEGFIDPSQRHIFISAPTAKELVQKLEVPPEYVPAGDGAVVKLRWEMEQVGYTSMVAEIAR